MGAITWEAYGTADTLNTTASVDSLADGSPVILDEVDNSIARKQYADLVVELDAAGSGVVAVGLDARIDVYLLPAVDGTNYPDPPGATPGNVTPNYHVGTISSVGSVGTPAAETFKRGVLRGIVLPPQKFKILLVNELGAAFPASGNSIKLYRYNESVA